MQSIRNSVYHLLEISSKKKSGGAFWVNLALTIIISLNALAIILDTVPFFQKRFHAELLVFEVFSVFVFTIEYLLRVWSAVEVKNEKLQRTKFVFSIWGIIDLLSILPFYLSFFVTDLGFLRILRLLRMIRLFRISRYFVALGHIQRVLKEKKEELVLSFVIIFFTLIISSSAIYFVEHTAQPKAFSSIPQAMWWAVNTMTTVGYGDLHPITPFGKLLGGLIAVLGVAVFALPTGILASGFADQVRGKTSVCPHCQKRILS